MRNFDGQNTQISQDFTASNLPGSKNQCYNIREVVSVELNFEGVVVGVMSLVIIGAFHPLVIWAEYIWSARCWPAFPGRRTWIFGRQPVAGEHSALLRPRGAGMQLPMEHPGTAGTGGAGT